MNLEQLMSPETVQNFLNYANAGLWDGTFFHRSITMWSRSLLVSPIAIEAPPGVQVSRGDDAGLGGVSCRCARTPSPWIRRAC